MSMIYPNVSLDEWLKKYDLEVEIFECSKCGVRLEVNIPILTKDSAGLISKRCDCGCYSATLTPRTKESKDFWNNVLG